MPSRLLLSALLTLPTLALGHEFDAEAAHSATAHTPPRRDPWTHIAHEVVSCTAVETGSNLSFRSVERRMTYDDACRSALESVAQKCASHFGGTFTIQPAGYAACEGDNLDTYTGSHYTCRISCGPALRSQ